MVKFIILFVLYVLKKSNIKSSLLHMPITSSSKEHYPFSSKVENDYIKIESNKNIKYLYKDGEIKNFDSPLNFDYSSITFNISNIQYYVTNMKIYYYNSTLQKYQEIEVFGTRNQYLSSTLITYESKLYVSICSLNELNPQILLLFNPPFGSLLLGEQPNKNENDITKITSYSCSSINNLTNIICIYTYDLNGKYFIISLSELLGNKLKISRYGELNLNKMYGINFYHFNDTTNSKIICSVLKNNRINCYQLTLVSLNQIIVGESLFEILNNCNSEIRDFNIENFGDEILGCCGGNNNIYCQRISKNTFSLIENIITIEKEGINILPKFTYFDNTFGVITFGNEIDNNVYHYYIYFPKCSNLEISFIKEYVFDNDNFFNITDRYSDNQFIVFIQEITSNSNYQFLLYENTNLILTLQKNSEFEYYPNYTLKIINLNDIPNSYNEKITYKIKSNTYSSENCDISLNFLTCSLNCLKCDNIYNNCTLCDNSNDYYFSPNNNNECVSLSNKEENWFLDKVSKKFYLCDVDCQKYISINSNDLIDCDKNKIYYPVENEDNICWIKGSKNNNYFFNSKNKRYEKCSSNCIKCKNKNNCEMCNTNYYLFNNNCYNECPEGTKINKFNQKILTCILDDTYFYNNEPLIISSSLSTILTLIQYNISEYTNLSPFFSGNNYIIQIYDLSYNKIMNEISKKFEISQIEMNNCKETLKLYYDLPKDSDLIILKIDKININSISNFVNFFIFDLKGDILDLSICNNLNITIIKKILNESLIDWIKVIELESINVNLFDPNDTFFNDICFSYSNNQSNDVILSDRRNDYFQNITPCEDNCNFFQINSSSKEVKCLCQGKKTDKIEEEKYENDENFKNVFIQSLKHNNLHIIVCYKHFFNFTKMKVSIAFWILLICLFVNIIAFIIFLKDGLVPLKTMLSLKKEKYSSKIKLYNRHKTIHMGKIGKKNSIKNNPPIKNNDINNNNDNSSEINSKGSDIKEISEDNLEASSENLIDNQFNCFHNEKSNQSNKNIIPLIQTGTHLISGYNINAGDIVIYKTNIPNKKSESQISFSSKNDEENILQTHLQSKFTKIEPSLKKNLTYINYYIQNLDTNKSIEEKISNRNNNNNNAIKRTALLVGNKIKKKIKEIENENDKVIFDNYSTHELLIMDYKEAKLYDNSSFCLTYWGYLKECQLFFNTFFQEIFLELKVIKIYSFILNISIIIFFNAAFFSDNLIHKKYKNNILTFWTSLPKSIYSVLSCFIIFSILNSLSNSTEQFEKTMKTIFIRSEYEKKCAKILKNLKIKLTFFFSLNFILMLFFWYYSSIFCAVYHSSQWELFKGVIKSLYITLFIPFPVALVFTFLRKMALKYKLKTLFKIIFFFKKLL